MADQAKKEDLQVVAFCLKDEEFAIDIQQLREVLKYVNITPLPQAAEFIEGVINLRGDVIPVIDLRKRFSINDGSIDAKTRIIIVEISGSLLGLVVDQVSEVLHFPADQIQDPPKGMLGAKTDFIQGIGKKESRLIIILKPDKILSSTEKIDLDDLQVQDMEETA